LRKNVPTDWFERYNQFALWQIPEDTYRYLFPKNYYPLMKRIINELDVNPKFIGTFFGHRLKYLHGQYKTIPFALDKIYDLFVFLKEKQLDVAIAPRILKQMFLHPEMDFDSILTVLKFKKIDKKDIISRIKLLQDKFSPARKDTDNQDKINSIMGGLRAISEGNVDLRELSKEIK